MKIIFTFSMILIIFTIGCTSYHTIKDTEFSYLVANRELERKQALIKLAGGEEFKGENIKVARDSTSWIELESQHKQVFPTSRVKEICIWNRTRRVMGGVLYGLIGGAFGGAFSGLLFGSTFSFETSGFGKYSLQGLVYGGATGATIGLVWGASGGYTDMYFLGVSNDSTFTKVNLEQQF